MKRTSMRRTSLLAIVVVVLLAIGGGLTALKHQLTGTPLLPGDAVAVWTIQARIAFEGRGTAGTVDLRLPVPQMDSRVIDEDFISRGFGLMVQDGRDGVRVANWSQRRIDRSEQALYYQVRVRPGPLETSTDVPPFPAVPDYPQPLGQAIEAVLARARTQSADVFSFAAQLIELLNDQRDENVAVIRKSPVARNWEPFLVEMLAGARIPARVAWGLHLDNGFTDRQLEPWLEVHNGQRWQGFDARTGQQGYPPDFFIWAYDSPDLVTARKVRDLSMGFSAAKVLVPPEEVRSLTSADDMPTLPFDLGMLPVETRNMYSVMLMIPLGALVIAVMRTVVGVPTFGTFMPVLIALAFRETELLWGIAMFLVVAFTGLAVRAAISNLRLLLVPRLTSVLIVVVLLMLGITLLSARLGFEKGLSVGMFPMVILAMTIERMSIVADEHGMLQTIKVTAGSLFVAVCGFFVMNEPHLMHLMLYFPEMMLVVLGLTLMLGAYTGYRLTELRRFKDLARPGGAS